MSVKSRITVPLIMLALITMGGIAIVGYPKYGEAICSLRQGKWYPSGMLGGQCMTQQCYQHANCGLLATPVAYCQQIVVGDPVSRVTLWLGNPTNPDIYAADPTTVNGSYLWISKNDGIVRVQFHHGIATFIDCDVQGDSPTAILE